MRLFAFGPADYYSNFGGIRVLGASHDKGLAVSGDIVSSHRGTRVKLAVKKGAFSAGVAVAPPVSLVRQ